MHIPVLLKEVVDCLAPQPNENFIDCTCGFAGHAKAVLAKNRPDGKVLGIEWDKDVFEKTKQANIERLVLVNATYSRLREIVKERKFGPVSGILLDLGMSSWDIESSGRGFSFQKDEPLDMRYDRLAERKTAADIVNNWSFKELEEIFKNYGQERFADRIAYNIIESRKIKPIETSFQLVEIIKKATPAWYHQQKIHPGTKTFQALRVAVNDELGNLKSVLSQATDCLMPGGRLVVISFHSLEDGLVKRFFKENSKSALKIITKKPTRPSGLEIASNPRARSASLRAAVKI